MMGILCTGVIIQCLCPLSQSSSQSRRLCGWSLSQGNAGFVNEVVTVHIQVLLIFTPEIISPGMCSGTCLPQSPIELAASWQFHSLPQASPCPTTSNSPLSVDILCCLGRVLIHVLAPHDNRV